MISIIIPAHNEEAVIARGLRAILTGAEPGELEIIVACNGCTDRTAEIARSFGPPVRVIEIEQASKITALNSAEAQATAFPRIFMDADVQLNLDSVRRLAAAFDQPGAMLIAPQLRMNLARTSWFVQAYYRVWTNLPYNQVMVGTGVYAISREGRARFGSLPNVIADDGFVRYHFSPEERRTIAAAEVWVVPPLSLAGLIRIKTRARLGQYQLRRLYPELRGADHKSTIGMLRPILCRPTLWLCLPVYLTVTMLTRWRARRLLATASEYHWARDDSREARLRIPLQDHTE